jgi:hypothetical protein
MELAEYSYATAPTPHVGRYLEEVVSEGAPRPASRFAP